MTASGNHGVDRFLDAWVQEVGRAIEMFTGERAVLHATRVPVLPASDGELLWFTQTFEGNGRFSAWVGSEQRTWSALGGISAGASLEEAKASYREMVSHAHRATATLLSRTAAKPIRCEEPVNDEKPELGSAEEV